jgi:integrase
VHVKQRADKTGIIGPVKSKAGKRTIYLPRIVTDMVFEWQDHCPDSPYDLVFPTDSGKPQALNNFRAGATDGRSGADDDGEDRRQARSAADVFALCATPLLCEQADREGQGFEIHSARDGHSKIEMLSP